MSKSSTITIACALCVGAAPERYLAAALAAIDGAVDALAVNDNSGLARAPNAGVLEASPFAARGALRVDRHPFVDFADMRNRAFAALAALPVRPDWVLFLDADEIHGEQVRYVAREILPRLGPEIGHVDAYTYHFFGTYRWITDVARRFVFYRYSPELYWVNAVHEKIVGLRGRALVLPYIYHHYGNVVPPGLLARKHGRYFELGNPVPRPPSEAEATVDVYLSNARRVRPFRGRHPAVAGPTLARLANESAATFADIDAGFRARRGAAARSAAAVRGSVENVRVATPPPRTSRALPRTVRGPLSRRVERVHLVSAILERDGTFLAVASRYPNHPEALWNLPGGRQRHGELLTQALVRECREETGLDVAVGELRYVSESYDRATATHFLNSAFTVAAAGTPALPNDDPHVVGLAWFTAAELASRLTVAVVREPLLAHLIDPQKRYFGFEDAGITIEFADPA